MCRLSFEINQHQSFTNTLPGSYTVFYLYVIVPLTTGSRLQDYVFHGTGIEGKEVLRLCYIHTRSLLTYFVFLSDLR